MKKYVVLAAAFAMVAFAGCKKEEKGLVTLMVGTENEQNDVKQAYNEVENTIMFESGDFMYLNGTPRSVTPLNHDNDPYTTTIASYKATIQVDAQQLSGDHFLAVYPVAGVDCNDNNYSVVFAPECTMIPQHINRASEDYNSTTLGLSYRTWPLSAYYTCGECVIENRFFQLKNDVAIFTPSVVYGYRWLSRVASQYGITLNENELPAITIDRVVINADRAISGIGYIDGLMTDEPHVVLNARVSNSLRAFVPDAVLPIECQRSNQAEIYVGNIPVPPFYSEGTVQMNTYFHMTVNGTTYYFMHQGNTATAPDGSIARGRRTLLKVNLLDGTDAEMAKLTMQTTEFTD